MRHQEDLAARKALLIAQADYDRMKLTLAVHDVRRLVRPPVDRERRLRLHPLASRLIGFALPLLGASRAGRMLRALSVALAVFRIVRNWRRA